MGAYGTPPAATPPPLQSPRALCTPGGVWPREYGSGDDWRACVCVCMCVCMCVCVLRMSGCLFGLLLFDLLFV
jgi:hypothetical protein